MLHICLLALVYFLLIGMVLRHFLSCKKIYFACVKISFGNSFNFLPGLEGFVRTTINQLKYRYEWIN